MRYTICVAALVLFVSPAQADAIPEGFVRTCPTKAYTYAEMKDDVTNIFRETDIRIVADVSGDDASQLAVRIDPAAEGEGIDRVLAISFGDGGDVTVVLFTVRCAAAMRVIPRVAWGAIVERPR